MLIEVYFIDLFFGVRLAFKRRIRSILATIRDQSCLNLRIESRRQGITKILLQNRLISSRFNQDLIYKGEEHQFLLENRKPSDSVKTNGQLRSRD